MNKQDETNMTNQIDARVMSSVERHNSQTSRRMLKKAVQQGRSGEEARRRFVR